MNKTQQDISDIGFIISETRRITAMPVEDLRAFFKGHERDLFYHLPHPEGRGMLPCGKEAYCKVGEISRRHLATQGDLSQRIDGERFRRAVAQELATRFLKEDRPVDEKQTARMFAAALKSAKRKIYDLTHFVPCVVFLDKAPGQFEIGPVKFIWMKDFLENNHEMIVSREPELVSRDLIPYYSRFPWVAQITVPQCDEPTSHNRACTTIEGALDALRLLIGASYTARFRQGHTPVALDDSASLTQDSTGKIGFSINRQWQDSHTPDKWYEKLRQQAGLYLVLTENSLEGLRDPSKASHLTQRFLDSLNWYGQAVKETHSASAIVKYVAALERTTMTKEHKKIAETLSRRTALLCAEGDKVAYAKNYALARDIYDWRSKLMHGSISPSHKALSAIRGKAARLTRFTLLAGLEFYTVIERQKPHATSVDLEKAYKHLELTDL